MEITEQHENGLWEFRPAGRLDSRTSDQLDERVSAAMADGATHIFVDGADLEYISSAGLRIFLKAAKRLKAAEGKIVLHSAADYIREVFEIAGFDTFIPIVEGREAALSAVEKEPVSPPPG